MQGPPPGTIDAYIDSLTDAIAKERIERIRKLVHESVPEASETISYGMPTFRLAKNFVWFAAFKKHVSLFGATTDLPPEAIRFKTSTGTLQFPHRDPLPEDLIRAVIRDRRRAHDQVAK